MGEEMQELLEMLKLPEPQREWIVEVLANLARQRDECMERNLVRLQTDMGPCQFIPKAQADEELKLQAERIEELEKMDDADEFQSSEAFRRLHERHAKLKQENYILREALKP